MADVYKRGFYLQEDYWLAVRECSAKVQNEVMGAIARLYFEGTDSSDSLKGTSKCVFIALRERVSTARTKSLARNGGACSPATVPTAGQAVAKPAAAIAPIVPIVDQKGEQKGEQKGHQTGYQNSKLLAKSESESEISTCKSTKTEHQPTKGEPAPWAAFVGDALSMFTEVTGRPCLIPSSEVTFGLRKIFDAGYTIEDVKLVCKAKQAEWGKDMKCQKWIRPQTLFGEKFESYLFAAKADPAKEARDASKRFADAI